MVSLHRSIQLRTLLEDEPLSKGLGYMCLVTNQSSRLKRPQAVCTSVLNSSFDHTFDKGLEDIIIFGTVGETYHAHYTHYMYYLCRSHTLAPVLYFQQR